MGPVSGWLWLAGSGVAVAAGCCPARRTTHAALFWGLVALTVAYSIACITRLIPWHASRSAGHALAVVTLQPLVMASLWLTGGADAYMGPVLVLPMLYVAYFFPAALRLAAGGAGGRDLRVPARHHGRAASPARRPLAGLRGRLRRADADDPVPQAAPGRRRAPPAPDRAAGPADRAPEPARVRRGAVRRARRRRPLHAAARRRRRVQADQRHASATRPATACCASWPRAPRPRSAPATAWPGSAATNSRWSPRAPAPQSAAPARRVAARGRLPRGRRPRPALADRSPGRSTPRTAPTASP